MAGPVDLDDELRNPRKEHASISQQHRCGGQVASASGHYGHQLQIAVAAQQQRLEELQQQRNHLLERIQLDRVIRAKEAAARAEVLKRVLKQQEVDQRWRCQRNEQLREQALQLSHWCLARGSRADQSEIRLKEQLQKVKQVMTKHAEGLARHSLADASENRTQDSDLIAGNVATQHCVGRARDLSGVRREQGSAQTLPSRSPPDNRVHGADTQWDTTGHSEHCGGQSSEASPPRIPGRRIAREPARLQLLALQYEEQLARLKRSDAGRRTELLRSHAFSSGRLSVSQSAEVSSDPSSVLSSITASAEAICHTPSGPANSGQTGPRVPAADRRGTCVQTPVGTAPVLSPLPVQRDDGGGTQPDPGTLNPERMDAQPTGSDYVDDPSRYKESSVPATGVATQLLSGAMGDSASPRAPTDGHIRSEISRSASPAETRLGGGDSRSTSRPGSTTSRGQLSLEEVRRVAPLARQPRTNPGQPESASRCATSESAICKPSGDVSQPPCQSEAVATEGSHASGKAAATESGQALRRGSSRQSCNRRPRETAVKKHPSVRWKEKARDILHIGKTDCARRRSDGTSVDKLGGLPGCEGTSSIGHSGYGNPPIGDEDDIELLLQGL